MFRDASLHCHELSRVSTDTVLCSQRTTILCSFGKQKETKARNNLIYLLTSQLNASDAFCYRSYEKWTVEHEHRQFHTSAQSTHVTSSTLFSEHPILHKFKRHNKCNSWRFDSLLLHSHIASHFYWLFEALKQIEKMFLFTRKKIRICSKINSFRNCERRIGWLEASKQPASVNAEHQAMVNRTTVGMISNNHKFQLFLRFTRKICVFFLVFGEEITRKFDVVNWKLTFYGGCWSFVE